MLSTRSMPCCGSGSWTVFPRLLRDWKTTSFDFAQFSFKLLLVPYDWICDSSSAHVSTRHIPCNRRSQADVRRVCICRWNDHIDIVREFQYFISVMLQWPGMLPVLLQSPGRRWRRCRPPGICSRRTSCSANVPGKVCYPVIDLIRYRKSRHLLHVGQYQMPWRNPSPIARSVFRITFHPALLKIHFCARFSASIKK